MEVNGFILQDVHAVKSAAFLFHCVAQRHVNTKYPPLCYLCQVLIGITGSYVNTL